MFTSPVKQLVGVGSKVDIIVEVFDLNEINKDQEYYLEHFTPINEIDKELVGTYKIIEILQNLKYIYNKNKQKSMLDIKYKELTLKEDGTTNYEDITWNKKHLLLKYDNKVIPLAIHKKENYIVVLMNEDFKYYLSQRPIEYLYEKIVSE